MAPRNGLAAILRDGHEKRGLLRMRSEDDVDIKTLV
jgi:hypothetical protein